MTRVSRCCGAGTNDGYNDDAATSQLPWKECASDSVADGKMLDGVLEEIAVGIAVRPCLAGGGRFFLLRVWIVLVIRPSQYDSSQSAQEFRYRAMKELRDLIDWATMNDKMLRMWVMRPSMRGIYASKDNL